MLARFLNLRIMHTNSTHLILTSEAWVAKLVDAADSKSSAYMNGKSGKIKNTTSMPEW